MVELFDGWNVVGGLGVFGDLLVLMLEKTHVQYVITPGTKIL
jgi:hypothetical protein